MIDPSIFFGETFPAPVESIFDKVVSLGWYDGTTSGLAFHALRQFACRFDLLDWGPCQEMRVFALSRIAVSDFEQAVGLLSRSETPNWPIWYPRWPISTQEQERMNLELDPILLRAKDPEYVFATESRFERLLAGKQLTAQARAFLPVEFDDQPFGHFDFWQKFLELSA
jgi:hypothetical protein